MGSVIVETKHMDLAQFFDNLKGQYFMKGSTISFERQFSNKVFFLKKGMVKIQCLLCDGKEIVKYLINEGELFGILALFDRADPDDKAIMLEDSVVCILECGELSSMLKNNIAFNDYFMGLAGRRIRELEGKIASISRKDAENRVKDFIFDYVTRFGNRVKPGRIEAKNLISNDDIGKLTATSRQTVNKILNELKRKEVIDFDKQIIAILL